MKRFVLVTFLSFMLTGSTASAQRFQLVVGGANFRPFPIAVPKVRIVGETSTDSKRLGRVLTDGIQTSTKLARSLALLPPKSYLAPEKEALTAPKFKNWLNVGASGLLRGSLEYKDGRAHIALYFFDVISQRQLLSRSYEEAPKAVGQVAHKFIDELVELLTGQKGIFSTRIAYVKRTKAGKAIYTCDMAGDDEQRITDPSVLSLLPEWGSAGRSILFTSYLKSNPDLYRINLDTQKLDWLSNKRGLNTGAAVSPDGTRIALTLSIDGNTEIYVMDTTGKNLTRLTDSWGQDVSPSWSPDGSRLAFVSSRSGHPHIYVMNADGSNPKRLSFRGEYNQEPDWSPRPGGQIAFTARDERLKYDIFLVHPDTGEMTRLTQDQGHNESPAHSPDGHHLVFTSTRPPGNGKKLYIMDVDGKNPQLISESSGYYETPSWGPRMGY